MSPSNTASTSSAIALKKPTTPEGINQSVAQSTLSPAARYLSAPQAKPEENTDEEGRDAAGMPTDPLRPDIALNLDDLNATQDLWGRVRRGFGLPDLDSPLVADHERWYATRPDYVKRMTERSSRYLFHVVEEIERRHMPTELALLPFIESAFNPQANSSARASGIWQFMPATGKDFELRQNIFRDDRRDVLASTRAALDYLQRLNKQFGDWHLALAAYNWGEGNVQKAINRNLKAGLPTDYLSLNMPPETRNYVPKLHAVRNIVLHPDTFGLSLPPIENHPYFVSVPIQRDMDVPLAARLAGLPIEDFKALNPSMNKPVILAAGTPQVLLPYDNASQFVHNLSQHKGLLATWTAWVVPRTMRSADAARQSGMSEASLREINRIPPKMLVKAGSTLLVPRSQHREQDVSESVADNAMMALAPDLPPMRRLSLRAGKNDSVNSLARRYKVPVAQVAQWNRVPASAKFKRGQTVVLFVPAGGKQSTRVARNGRPTVHAQARHASQATTRLASASRTVVRSKGRSAPTRSSRMRVASAR
ncbi:MAG: transglycosylase SLT domain-containing protein [Burkholderiales bacterium]|nr:transglycosylase SLT domain-containing protein [Burkholderiales bacterium]